MDIILHSFPRRHKTSVNKTRKLSGCTQSSKEGSKGGGLRAVLKSACASQTPSVKGLERDERSLADLLFLWNFMTIPSLMDTYLL